MFWLYSDNMFACVLVSPAVLLDEIEAAEGEGNDDRIEGVLCGAVKQLKMNRAKPDMTLYLSLMFLAKIKPNVFATEGVIEVENIYFNVEIFNGVTDKVTHSKMLATSKS